MDFRPGLALFVQDSAFPGTAGYLRETFKTRPPEASASRKGLLLLKAGEGWSWGPEGYSLEISEDRVEITAATDAGAFHALQTFRQLLPPECERGFDRPCALPCLSIQDTPRFAWRGFMIDVSRTFLGPGYLKRLIDVLALYKFNVLHLHLTDDQGWRMQTKAYPKLTTVGAHWSVPSEVSDGFYTQEEIRDLVHYAAARQIVIVPEIEMPGHSLGALAAYPELSCTGQPFEVKPFPIKGNGIQKDIFCAGNPATYEFFEKVLEEAFGIFPSPYLHLGGDEVPKDRWKACPKCQALLHEKKLTSEEELQTLFMNRFAAFLLADRKRPIVWDEVFKPGLDKNTIVMVWHYQKLGVDAANAGYDVILSPSQTCYLDVRSILRDTYNYEPLKGRFTEEGRAHVMGIQGALWTHIDTNEKAINARLFPRLLALAEVAWSAPERKDFTRFKAGLPDHQKRFSALMDLE